MLNYLIDKYIMSYLMLICMAIIRMLFSVAEFNYIHNRINTIICIIIRTYGILVKLIALID